MSLTRMHVCTVHLLLALLAISIKKKKNQVFIESQVPEDSMMQ